MSDHSLIVTYHDFSQPNLLASGVYLRLGTLAAGLVRLGLPIRMLCTLAAGSPEPLAAAQERVGKDLARAWKVAVEPICIRRCAPSPSSRARLWASYVVRPSDARVPACPEYLTALAAELDRRPSLILAHRLNPMLALLESGRSLPPICFDLDDIVHKFLWRSLFSASTVRAKLLGLAAIPAAIAAEWRVARAADRILVCSSGDAAAIRGWMGHSKVQVVPNTVAVPEAASLSSAPVMLMLGAYSYEPNADGAEFMITQVFPQVRRSIPNAELWLVGADPENVPSFRKPPEGVLFPGFLDEIGGVYTGARVVVCPIRYGSGTRVKLVEAAAWGKPIVSTRIGAEGISFSNGKDVLLADRADAFAKACVRLLQDDQLAMELGAAARALATHSYDRSGVVEMLAGMFAAALKSG